MISDELFNEIKQAAIDIWHTYDNTYGYVDEKMATIKRIKNISDNYGTFIGMFDVKNQEKMYNMVGDDAKQLIDSWVGDMAQNVALAKEMGVYE